MSKTTKFNLSDAVIPLDGKYPGTVIAIRESQDGRTLYDVLSTNGRVMTWTAEGLKANQSYQ